MVYAFSPNNTLGTKTWQGITCSDNGQTIIATEFAASPSNNYYVSIDGGANYTALSVGGEMISAAITANGSQALIGDNNANVYLILAVNSFGSPTLLPQTGTFSIAPGGSHHSIAPISSLTIYTSTDNGSNYYSYTFVGNIRCVSCFDTGAYVILGGGLGIQKSIDLCTSFSTVFSASANTKSKISCSNNGNTVFAYMSGIFYASNDAGSSWQTVTVPGFFSPSTSASIEVSGDGSTLFAASDNGYIYASTDLGINWEEQTSAGSRQWVDTNYSQIASSFDGSKIYATAVGDYLYVGTTPSAPTIIDGTNNIVTTNTTWGDGSSLSITVPAFVQSGTLTLDVPSISIISGVGSITVEPGASISINGPTGTRTITTPFSKKHRLKL
jgi:hypothetical protein